MSNTLCMSIAKAERAKLAMKGDSAVLDACIYFERRFTLAGLMIGTACWAQSCLRSSVGLGIRLHLVKLKVRAFILDIQQVIRGHTPRKYAMRKHNMLILDDELP